MSPVLRESAPSNASWRPSWNGCVFSWPSRIFGSNVQLAGGIMRTVIVTAVLVGSVGLFAQTRTGLDGPLPSIVVPAALTACDAHAVAQRIARAAGVPLGFEAITTCNSDTHPARLSGTWTFERKLAPADAESIALTSKSAREALDLLIKKAP